MGVCDDDAQQKGVRGVTIGLRQKDGGTVGEQSRLWRGKKCSRSTHTALGRKGNGVGYTVQVKRITAAYCCDSLLIAKAAVALDTRRGGLKAKRDGVDVKHNEGSVQGYQEQEDVQ